MRRASGLLEAIWARRDELVNDAARQSFPASDLPAFEIDDDGLAISTGPKPRAARSSDQMQRT
jgi:hypothetical protein